MKQTKILICALAVGAATVVTSNVYAIPGPVTVSGTALSQNVKNSYDVVKTNTFNQKILLQVLAQATGDSSITNKKTTVYYDPEAFNENAYDSNEGYEFYGVFYYSNSVTGPDGVYLDGIDESGDYYSYIELDYYNWLLDDNEGFWSGDNGAYNAIFGESKGKETAHSNALLYIHSDPYFYDLPDADYYYANDWDGVYQDYAFVLQGAIKYGGTISLTSETTSGTLSGSGDGLYQDNEIVVHGTATFTAKEKL